MGDHAFDRTDLGFIDGDDGNVEPVGQARVYAVLDGGTLTIPSSTPATTSRRKFGESKVLC